MKISLIALIALISMAGCSDSKSGVLQGCDAQWHNSRSDNPYCYDLQLQLAESASVGDLAVIKSLIAKGANVNGGAYQSQSALTAAASSGHHDTVHYLVETGATVNRIEGVGNTALKSAAYYGHVQSALILLKNGADLCEATETSALDEAKRSGNDEMIDLLVRWGADKCG